MICRDCKNFKSKGIEAGRELGVDLPRSKGKCNISGKKCRAEDNCGCGAFSQK